MGSRLYEFPREGGRKGSIVLSQVVSFRQIIGATQVVLAGGKDLLLSGEEHYDKLKYLLEEDGNDEETYDEVAGYHGFYRNGKRGSSHDSHPE